MEKGDKGSTLIRMGVSGWMFLLVPAYPGCPGSKAVKRLLLLLLLWWCHYSKPLQKLRPSDRWPATLKPSKTTWTMRPSVGCYHPHPPSPLIIRLHHMHRVQKDAASCCRRSIVCMCLLDTTVSPTKIAAPVKMPFGVWTWVSPKNHKLGGPDHPRGRGNFRGCFCPTQMHQTV